MAGKCRVRVQERVEAWGVENAQEKTAVQVAQDGTDDTVVTGVTQKSSRINSRCSSYVNKKLTYLT